MALPESDDLNTSLLKELECPICFQHCTPPIFMCPESHNVCRVCLEQITECPICRGPKPTIRNRLAETMSMKVKFPCTKNKVNGCVGMYTLKELEFHLSNCDITCKCYAGTFECTWQGLSSELLDHVQHVHPNYITLDSCHTMQFKLVMIWESLCLSLSRLFFAHRQLFWVEMFYVQESTTTNYFCFSAMCVSGSDIAAKYKCEFKFCSKDKQYETTLRVPMNYEHNKPISYETQCARLNESFMKHFIHNNVIEGKVTILEK